MPVFAHQGGWDELLLVLAPLVVFGALLVVAKRRAGLEGGDEDEEAPADGSLGGDVGPE